MNIMRTLFLALIAFTFVLQSCDTADKPADNEYLIEGKLANAAGMTIFLDKWDNLTTATPVDTGIISKEGAFTLKNRLLVAVCICCALAKTAVGFWYWNQEPNLPSKGI